MTFDYFTAFERNIGWVADAEQRQLRTKRVAIAGMGGVGGFHLLTLARLGISRFAIADLDYLLDTSLTRDTLGWSPRHRDEDILLSAYESFLAGRS
jgi:tRNA A37 threonylcarbamoyladenosine dehydratase